VVEEGNHLHLEVEVWVVVVEMRGPQTKLQEEKEAEVVTGATQLHQGMQEVVE
jgi:hypothetical protein